MYVYTYLLFIPRTYTRIGGRDENGENRKKIEKNLINIEVKFVALVANTDSVRRRRMPTTLSRRLEYDAARNVPDLPRYFTVYLLYVIL